MYQHVGKCDCGEVRIQFISPKELDSYVTRVCDCDYCVSLGIEYLSDAAAQIRLFSYTSLNYDKHGSEQAKFLLCSKCQTVVAACYIDKVHSVGSVNARLLNKFSSIKKTVVVSPKTLGKTAKIKRWRELWSPIQIEIA